MTVHWETSQKPLFVKTIWTDGHHHAVLHAQDPLLFAARHASNTKQRNFGKNTRKLGVKSAQEKKTSRKCAIERSYNDSEDGECQAESDNDLNISTVRIPLTSVRKSSTAKLVNQRSAQMPCDRELRRVYTIDVVPNDVVKCRIFDPFQSFSHQPENAELQTHHVSNENQCHQNHLGNVDFTCSKLFETPRDTTLTDRVLVWLDLAKNTSAPNQKPTLSQAVPTSSYANMAHVVRVNNVSRTVTPKVHQYSAYPNAGSAIKHGRSYVNVVRAEERESRTSTPTGIANDYARIIEKPPPPPSPPQRRIVEPRLQINSVGATDCYPVGPRPAAAIGNGNANGFVHDTKRQLHIFLPDVIKTPDCCDSASVSVISSRISS